jgi:large subunit ribosomal protein L5
MAKDADNKKQGGEAAAAAPKQHAGKDPRAAKGGPAKRTGGHKGYSAEIVAEAEKPAQGVHRLKAMYDGQVRAKVAEKFGIKNPMAQPRLQKIVINVNMGRHLEGTKIPPNVKETIIDTVTKIAGQKPVVQKAKKSVSNFKLRAGFESSVIVTMRRDRMWNFLDRFINLAAPRIKDFRGLPDKAFDRQGNYSCGVTEQGVFPEINMAEVTFTHGMHINFVFSNSEPKMSKFVLENLGFPFSKPDQKN